MTSSNGSIFRVTGPLCGEFTGSPVNFTHKGQWRSFDVFFHLCPDKWLSKQSWGWWLETPSHPLWRHCNEDDHHQLLETFQCPINVSHCRLKSPASRLFTQPSFRRRSKKTSKLRVTGLCAGNSQVTGEFAAQRASNAESVSIWWRHHGERSPH